VARAVMLDGAGYGRPWGRIFDYDLPISVNSWYASGGEQHRPAARRCLFATVRMKFEQVQKQNRRQRRRS